MKKFLILMIVFVSNLLLLSACSSDNDESGDSKARYYIKYTVTGGSWYRPPFGHTSNPTPTTIKFLKDKLIVLLFLGVLTVGERLFMTRKTLHPSLCLLWLFCDSRS